MTCRCSAGVPPGTASCSATSAGGYNAIITPVPVIFSALLRSSPASASRWKSASASSVRCANPGVALKSKSRSADFTSRLIDRDAAPNSTRLSSNTSRSPMNRMPPRSLVLVGTTL